MNANANANELPSLIAANLAALDEGRALIERLPEGFYGRPEPRVRSAGIGSHFRHLLEHFGRLLDGLQSGSIDYDARARDPELERSSRCALAGIDAVKTRLEALRGSEDGRLRIKMDAAGPPGGAAPRATSTLCRELQSVLSHTIHHYALIATILRLQGFEPGEEFGVAPSTLRYWKEAGRCAP